MHEVTCSPRPRAFCRLFNAVCRLRKDFLPFTIRLSFYESSLLLRSCQEVRSVVFTFVRASAVTSPIVNRKRGMEKFIAEFWLGNLKFGKHRLAGLWLGYTLDHRQYPIIS